MTEHSPAAVSVSEQPGYMERCLNCEAALHGRFCAECGQRVLPPRPTMRELLAEAWGEFVNLDGKVATTLRLLITRPGFLTVEALAGRRARYIGAVRLYLLCSLLYFGGSSIIAGVPAVRAREAAHRAAASAARARETRDASGEPADCSSTATGLQGALDRRNCQEERDPERAGQAARGAAPKAMFVLLPLFALIVALAFRRDAYIEHLYFALHLHAFAFVVLLLARATDLTATAADDSWGTPLALAAAFAYGSIAARRFYARGWLSTIARFAGVLALYFIATAVVLIATFTVATLTM
jgi:hypothetical protein